MGGCNAVEVVVTVTGEGAVFCSLGAVSDLVMFGVTDIEDITAGIRIDIGDPCEPAIVTIDGTESHRSKSSPAHIQLSKIMIQ